LDLEGTVITIDAMGTQKEIARQVIDGGGDYVLALKANQGRLFEEVQESFTLEAKAGVAGTGHDHYETVNGGHGRIEGRKYWSIWDPEHLAYLDEKGEWPGLRSIAMVEAERQVGEEMSRERRYYLSSLSGPVFPEMPRSWAKPSEDTGASRTVCTGCWTWPSAKMTAGLESAIPRKIWPCCGAWP
jgi:predicted transposase YbfD/YdcC